MNVTRYKPPVTLKTKKVILRKRTQYLSWWSFSSFCPVPICRINMFTENSYYTVCTAIQTHKQMTQGHSAAKTNKWSVNMIMVGIMDGIMDAQWHTHAEQLLLLYLTLIGILCPWAVCDMELKSVVQRHKHACLLARTQEHTYLMFSDSLSLIRNNCCMFVQLWNWTKSHSI